ncbi:hypothetical protein BJ981_002376 [Sphaerisporangium krabiense]|uniref:Uncharacterized protein n=1 Tax=Sphaerisporangium krabiense TaxID=763782 RepID=A0A7W9DPN5_9ACTN|nr:hypothetical protein [Sphaerisporangium krabiense]
MARRTGARGIPIITAFARSRRRTRFTRERGRLHAQLTEPRHDL